VDSVKAVNGISRSKIIEAPAMIHTEVRDVNSETFLSECEKGFIKARMDPFGIFNKPPCNPIRDPGPSIKFRSYYQGTMITGSSGEGFVAITPFDPFNGARVIAFTNGASALGADAFNVTAGGVSYATLSDSPVTNTNGSYKIVGAGLKMCYIGRVLDCAGTVTRYSAPGNHPVTSALISTARGLQTSKTVQVQQASTYTNYFLSANDSDDDLIETYQDISIFGAVDVLFVNNTTPNSSFNFEVAFWYEWIPGPADTTLRGLMTASEGGENPNVITQATHNAKDAVGMETKHNAPEVAATLAESKLRSSHRRKNRVVGSGPTQQWKPKKVQSKPAGILGPLSSIVHTVEDIPVVGGIVKDIEGAAGEFLAGIV